MSSSLFVRLLRPQEHLHIAVSIGSISRFLRPHSCRINDPTKTSDDRLQRLGLELGVELAAEEEGVARDLDDFDIVPQVWSGPL